MIKKSQNFFDTFNASDDIKIRSLLAANINSKCIQIGVKYEIFSHINNGIEDVKQLAKKLNFLPDRLYRVLKNLEDLNIVKEKNENIFQLTTLGEKFLPENKGNYADLTLLWDEEFSEATLNLEKALKTEKSGFEFSYNDSLYNYLDKNPKKSEIFNNAMRGLSESYHNDIPKELELKSIETIADVGGGSGAILRGIINNYSQIKGILFDQKNVIEKAIKEMELFQHKNRVELISGDFFKPLPFKADCILMSNIIHNWNDEKATQILINCRNALTENGKIYLIETALESSIEPLLARSMDLSMLIMTNGKERTFKDFEKIFNAAGLALSNAKNILNITCLIEIKAI